MMTAGSILQSKGKEFFRISPGATAYEALELMAEKDIGALIVMEDGQIAGVFSERDYARKVILKGKSSKETPVRELMSTPVFAISPDKSIEECMALMTAVRCRHLPVVEDGKVLGVVSIGDVVNTLITEQKIAIRDLERYVAGEDYMVEARQPAGRL